MQAKNISNYLVNNIYIYNKEILSFGNTAEWLDGHTRWQKLFLCLL